MAFCPANESPLRPNRLQYVPAFLSAASTVASGSSKVNGASSRRHGAIAGIPSCDSFILGVDDQHDAADLRCGQQAASACREQKLSADSLALQSAIHSQARQAEARHIMACQPAPYDLRRLGVVDRCGAQTVEAENGFIAGVIGVITGVNRKKSFRAAPFVALAGVTAQEFVQRFFAAFETFPVMLLANRLFVPRGHDYGRLCKARAAASSFALGAGGFSSRSRTRRLSLSESCT